jgi:hypothetical protein
MHLLRNKSGRCVLAAKQVPHRPGIARRSVCAPEVMALSL